jgi:Brp/Blh family beta-carotene 15,15'-monooxygenase
MIFFTVFLFWISIQFGELVEDSIAYMMVLSIGIVHGSNDLIILKKQHANRKHFLKSIVGYVFLIVICVLSFYLNAFLSLLLFILLSAYHFGEQHFEDKLVGRNEFKFGVYLSYGLLIFSLIFWENLSDVDQIVYNLSRQTFSKQAVLICLVTSGSIFMFLMGYLLLKKKHVKLNLIKEIFYLILLYLVFKTTSLILGFAIYFVFWHSIPSIIDQTKYLSGSINKSNVIRYFRTAGLIWTISIFGLVAMYFVIEESLFSSSIFLLLFAVTAPHAWVMYRMKSVSRP